MAAAQKVAAICHEATGDAQLKRLELDASKTILKYFGFEKEQVEHTGHILISPKDAALIVEASDDE